jgi:hypothetical protein
MSALKLFLLGFILILFILGFHGYGAYTKYYTAKHGKIIFAKVVDNSAACRRNYKHLWVNADGKIRRVEIFYDDCRIKDFPVGKIIRLRKSDSFDKIVSEKNNYRDGMIVLTVAFVLLLAVVIFLLRGMRIL